MPTHPLTDDEKAHLRILIEMAECHIGEHPQGRWDKDSPAIQAMAWAEKQIGAPF